ncbi:MAG: hypothetical protein HQK58_15120, partial [Deltaproteobacteria bacterium]|nr:hypothetical protein [Deltaproteobacteria bacterium]
LISKLDIEPVSPFDMDPLFSFGLGFSFCNLDRNRGLYLTPGIKALMSQNFAILKPSHVWDVMQLLRGLRKAKQLLDAGELDGLTVEQALLKIPEISGDGKLIFIGGLCLISSMYCNDMLDAPASFFIEKLKIHDDLLPPKCLFAVRFAKNRTKSYVEAMACGFNDKIVLNADIETVLRPESEVILVMKDGRKLTFDQVIFACNADQALALLQEPTEKERKLLGAWRYTEGRVAVHSDHTYFPRRDLIHGYTFLYREQGRYIETSISGSLWALPGVSKDCNLISTQHPNFPIDPDRLVFDKVFRTPIFDFNSGATISELPSLNGIMNTYYCGSHFGFGVHEDAVTSALEVARALKVDF